MFQSIHVPRKADRTERQKDERHKSENRGDIFNVSVLILHTIDVKLSHPRNGINVHFRFDLNIPIFERHSWWLAYIEVLEDVSHHAFVSHASRIYHADQRQALDVTLELPIIIQRQSTRSFDFCHRYAHFLFYNRAFEHLR